MQDRNHWNAARYDGSERGHYESYFQRANHPSEPRAFWIRYTVFSPKGRPSDALGQLWAIYFDRTKDRIVPGGSKTCLNSKVARCEVTLERGGEAQTFTTKTRAAFEILTDDSTHGVPVLAA